MLYGFRGNRIDKLLVDTSFFRGNNLETIERVFNWNAKLYFPSLEILEINEFLSIPDNQMPIIDKKWKFLQENLLNAENNKPSRILVPSAQDLINASQMLTRIYYLREKKSYIPDSWTQEQSEKARKILGNLSKKKSAKENLRFDVLFYIMTRTYLHRNFGFLTNNYNDVSIFQNIDYWNWDGTRFTIEIDKMSGSLNGVDLSIIKMVGSFFTPLFSDNPTRRIDPMSVVIPVFSFEEFEMAQSKDVHAKRPILIIRRDGDPKEFFMEENKV